MIGIGSLIAVIAIAFLAISFYKDCPDSFAGNGVILVAVILITGIILFTGDSVDMPWDSENLETNNGQTMECMHEGLNSAYCPDCGEKL